MNIVLYCWEDDYLYVDLANLDKEYYDMAMRKLKQLKAFDIVHKNYKDLAFEFYPSNDDEEDTLNTVYCDMERLNCVILLRSSKPTR